MDGLMQDFPLTLPMVLRRAGRYGRGGAVVVTGPGGRLQRTWPEVIGRVGRLGNALRRSGVGPGTVVASLAWNIGAHLELYLAVPCIGAVLHTLNARIPAEDLRHVLTEARDDVVVVQAGLTGLLAEVAAGLAHRPRVIVVADGQPVHPAYADAPDYERLVAAEATEFTPAVVDERAAALLCHTSGTTGAPKGVLYSHRSEVLHAMAALGVDSFAVSRADTVLLVSRMYHANGWGLPYAAALAGAGLVFTGADADPDTVLDTIAAERVTLAAAVPAVWVAVDAVLADRERAGRPADLSSLRAVLSGGAATSEELIGRYRRRGVPVLQGWGMTETSPNATIAGPLPAGERQARQGLPVPGVELRICDRDGRELPWDGRAVGEVEVRGPWVATGYLRQPAASDAVLHDGWLRTGDLGTIDPDGCLRVVDRIKDLIKSGGEWISSVTLEGHLMGHPAVREAAVVGLPDPRWGERPLALVVSCEPGWAEPDELIGYLRGVVPKWWVPDRFVFCPEIPRTSTGKFDKRRIRRRYHEGGST